jgi:hypothetical protein
MTLKKVANITALLLGALVLVRWFYLIDLCSVNLLVKDQWDFYDTLFLDQSYWSSFTYQLGPHRMGLGMVVTRLLAELSSWNTRVEAFSIGVFMALACVLFLQLKHKLAGSLHYTDLILPLLFFNTAQHEIFTGTPILSHGVMPVFLLGLYCLSWLWKHPYRYPLLLLLNFILLYTGFGFFTGFITLLLLGMELLKPSRHSPSRALLFAYLMLALASVCSFFIGYRFEPTSTQQGPWYTYLLFIFRGLGRFAESTTGRLSLVAGAVVFLSLFFVCMLHLRKLYRGEQPTLSRVIVILTAYTLLFLLGVAYGRTFLEPEIQGAYASRYIPHFIPGIIGIYLYLCTSAPFQKALPQLLLIALLVLSFKTQEHLRYMQHFKTAKLNWKEAYLKTGSVEAANAAAHFNIYPAQNQEGLQQKLAFLKEHKLNLFAGER